MGPTAPLRRQFFRWVRDLAAGAAFLPGLGGAGKASGRDEDIRSDDLRAAGRILGLDYSEAERERMLEGVRENLRSYETLRAIPLNGVEPALRFDPVPAGGTLLESNVRPARWSQVEVSDVPTDIERLAFRPVIKLARLIESRRVTSVALTRMYLARLKRFDPVLRCVVTLTEELALRQARRADDEIAAGRYRGLLHGIPWGVKDLFAARGYPTTWGAPVYRNRILDLDATVVERLDQAGAVLVAKLSLGPLARGDEWYGGMTRNPWNTEQGSGGSSAGSAASVAAGLVGFSVGSSTLDSIIGPSARCGVTGLRPTYGRISRHGAMALSWSLDKVGPICRTVEDCAAVLDALAGPDGKDVTVSNLPFNWDAALDIRDVRLGYVRPAAADTKPSRRTNDEATLEVLRSLGLQPTLVELPELPPAALLVMHAEAAAAFDELVQGHRDDELQGLIGAAWPVPLRQSLLISAVDYLRANRVRTLLMQSMARLMSSIDVYVVPTGGIHNSFLTNLTGHPCITVPNGLVDGLPTAVSFVGRLFEEAKLLAVARAYQEATDFHRRFPPAFEA